MKRLRKEESYLTEEARRIFESMTTAGVDPDLALEVLDLIMTEDEMYELG